MLLLILSAGIARIRADFGETFAATTVGSALGTAVGTIVGNATSPKTEVRVYEEKVVPVDRVRVIERVRSPRKGKLARLEREEHNLCAEIEGLMIEKQSIERRIRALEQELIDTQTAIDIRKQSLKNIEARKKQFAAPAVCVTKGPEFAEIEVH
jgi:hypothetical protein